LSFQSRLLLSLLSLSFLYSFLDSSPSSTELAQAVSTLHMLVQQVQVFSAETAHFDSALVEPSQEYETKDDC
jgi:hypothetical protein